MMMKRFLVYTSCIASLCIQGIAAAASDCDRANYPNLPGGTHHIGITVGQLIELSAADGHRGRLHKLLVDLRGQSGGCSQIPADLNAIIARVEGGAGAYEVHGDIVRYSEKLKSQISDYCKCTCGTAEQKFRYTAWKAPYGPGPICMTRAEAQAYVAGGGNVQGPYEPCQ